MQTTELGLLAGSGILTVICSGIFVYQLYHLVLLDATSRGIQHPKFWSLLASGSQGGGVLLYLFKRKSYAKTMNTKDRQTVERIRRRILFLLMMDFIAIGFCLFCMIYYL